MSDDQEIAIPVNRPDNYSAEQPPKDNAAAAACPVQPPKDDARPSSSPEEDASPVHSPMDDIAPPACLSPLPSDETAPLVPKIEPESSEANSPENAEGVEVKHEIKHETIDLGNEPHYYDEDDEAVGFARGLEPDRIVGATKVNEKLMFLVAWKNARIADLLEATEVYNRCPQIAIKFLESQLKFVSNDQSN